MSRIFPARLALLVALALAACQETPPAAPLVQVALPAARAIIGEVTYGCPTGRGAEARVAAWRAEVARDGVAHPGGRRLPSQADMTAFERELIEAYGCRLTGSIGREEQVFAFASETARGGRQAIRCYVNGDADRGAARARQAFELTEARRRRPVDPATLTQTGPAVSERIRADVQEEQDLLRSRYDCTWG